MRSPSCQTCTYRQPDERPEYSMSGFCHRQPPQVIFERYDVDGQVTQHYPYVTPDDWCGEYQETTRHGDAPDIRVLAGVAI